MTRLLALSALLSGFGCGARPPDRLTTHEAAVAAPSVAQAGGLDEPVAIVADETIPSPYAFFVPDFSDQPASVRFHPSDIDRISWEARVAVFGHEFGHALFGSSQLDADRWAGCTLGSLGLRSQPHLSLLRSFGEEQARIDSTNLGLSQCPGFVSRRVLPN